MRHLCEHTSLTHLTTSTKYTCDLSIRINVLLDLTHNLACGLSMSAANSRDFTVVVSRKQIMATVSICRCVEVLCCKRTNWHVRKWTPSLVKFERLLTAS